MWNIRRETIELCISFNGLTFWLEVYLREFTSEAHSQYEYLWIHFQLAVVSIRANPCHQSSVIFVIFTTFIS